MNEIDVNRAEAPMLVQKPAIDRETRPGMDVTRVSFPTHQELHLSLRPIPGERPLAMVSRLAGWLKDCDATVVRHEVFGSLTVYAETMRALRRDVDEFAWPVTWVEGKTTSKLAIAGMHVFAVAGTRVETLYQEGRTVGRIFSDGCFKHCFLGGISSLKPNPSKSNECREVLERLADILSTAGMDMTHVVRTWFFLEDILGWYGDFNRVRNEFFHRKKVFHGLVPASTGIGGRNPAGSALLAGLWAVQPVNELATVREVGSPLQGSAMKYGSAFSRAVLMEGGGWRRLLVSGTASIEPGGRSVHGGDLTRQIRTSREVTQALLESCGFDSDDVTRATGYLKDRQDALSAGWCGGQSRQCVIVPADICRPELLFEIELDALRPTIRRSEGRFKGKNELSRPDIDEQRH
jgi:enamine deaminase RidA (YjgF/YER057c/UK114 family)